MKRAVWKNKSNGQLCVTIPQNSGFKEGDIADIRKEKISKIVYTSVAADLFHYGQLRLLKEANNLGDFHICGVLTDRALKAYKGKPISGFRDRIAIISSLRNIDMVMSQNDLNPTDNIRKIREQFNDVDICVVYGSNWKKVPGEEYLKKTGCEIIHLPFYEKLSRKNIIKKIIQINKKENEK